tara:strand:- start:231 stop:1127 length:897 start_codon:yes stop_codon:yes gene_type:complete
MGLDVSALADYTEQVNGRIIPKIVFEGFTTSILPIQSGIKFKESLNLFEVDLQVQSGDCVSTPSGSFDASQRVITVTQRTSYDGLCLDNLNPKYLGISALDKGSYNETFKLASVYTEQIVNQMKKSNDSFLWNSTDGLGKLTSGSEAGVVVPDAATGSVDSTTIIGITDALIANINDDYADRDDLSIWMSVANFRTFIVALRNLNNYFFSPGDIDNRTGLMSIKYPFQNITVYGTRGVIGDRIVLMPNAYAVIGTDELSDVDNFQLWYDVNADQLKHRLKSKLGVQIAYPNAVVSNGL